MSDIMTKLEERIYHKFNFFFLKRNCEKFFDQLVEIPIEERFKEGKVLKIHKNSKPVSYDSPYEKKIIEDLDRCSFVKKIKTQSIVLNYKTRTSHKIKKYYPDLQVLLEDGRLVIIEVKPFKEMVNHHNMIKHEALKKYCKRKGYGYAILDCDYYSFEDLKREKVPISVQYKFIKFVKQKKKVTFEECVDFKKENNITDYQICYIIWKYRKKILKYQQHTIFYQNDC